MSSYELYNSLLRPTVLQILRAAGFQTARPTVVDILVDFTARYLIKLGQSTASYSLANHGDLTPSILDVRSALQDVGALRPQMSIMDEHFRGAEDLRGVEAFLAWAKGDVNREIRRVAGLIPSEGEVVAVEAGEETEDFLTALKKKHSKTGEESRYQGTVLGKAADAKSIPIEGGQLESIQAWQESLERKDSTASSVSSAASVSVIAEDESSPLTDIG